MIRDEVNRTICALVATATAALLLAAPAAAATDPLDPAFGSGGKATVDRGTPGDELYDVASRPDGRSLVAVALWRYPTQQEFALMRLTPEGAVDESFGDGGTAAVDIGGYYDYPRAVLPLPDGSILVAGGSSTDRGYPSFARFTEDGSLDPSFGEDGTLLDTSSPLGSVHSAVLLSDGRVLVAGSTAAYPYDLGVGRYLPDGEPDGAFGDGGATILDFGYAEFLGDLLVAPGGEILVIGSQFGDEEADLLVARLTSVGAPDSTFGEGGVKVVDVPDSFRPVAAALGAEGGIVVAGQLLRYPYLLGAVVRLDAAGELDDAFGEGGVVVVPSSGYMADVAVRSNGSIVAAGSAGSVDADFVVALLTAGGDLDDSFGTSGVATTDFFGEADEVSAMAFAADGRLLVAGRADKLPFYWQTDYDLAFARYILPPPAKSPAEEIAGLRAAVAAAGLPAGATQSLLALLTAAERSLLTGTRPDACGELEAVANHLAAQAGRTLPASLADAWLADVARIQALIDCRQTRGGS